MKAHLNLIEATQEAILCYIMNTEDIDVKYINKIKSIFGTLCVVTYEEKILFPDFNTVEDCREEMEFLKQFIISNLEEYEPVENGRFWLNSEVYEYMID